MKVIKIAGVTANDVINGEGVCVSVWMQGCPHRCKGCHNPETWDFEGGTLYNQDMLAFEILKLIEGETVVLTGQTGVGKSTLLNKINPDFNLETNDISEALGRGKHTTRHVELFEVGACFIADTPGFSALDVTEEDKLNIRFTFPEFENELCKFSDCKHLSEKGCHILEQVEEGKILKSRYESYKKMVSE